MKFNEQVTIENYIIEFLSGVNPAKMGGAKSTGSSRRSTPQDDRSGMGYEYIKPEVFSGFREYENCRSKRCTLL